MEMYHDVKVLSFSNFETLIEKKQLYLVAKRGLDIAISFVLLVVSIPVFLIVSILIKTTSKGPAIFSQERNGINDKKFLIYKFRTMYQDNCYKSVIIDADSSVISCIKSRNDKRVTPFGKLLRMSSLDEIPQLINVFRGDMSLVGPRPLFDSMLTPYLELKRLRSSVKPGITGLWQIRNREHCRSLLDMIDYDIEYITNLSLKQDLKILIMTIWVVLIGKGAY